MPLRLARIVVPGVLVLGSLLLIGAGLFAAANPDDRSPPSTKQLVVPPPKPVAPPTTTPSPPPAAPWIIDDLAIEEVFVKKLGDLNDAGKCLPFEKLKKLTSENRKAKVVVQKPREGQLTPEEVYERILPGVFLIGSIQKDEDDNYVFGTAATAWVLAADGILVTNWHLFDGLKDEASFGAMNSKQEVFPLTDVLAIDKSADVAIVRVAGKNFQPLPLANEPPRIGAWVGILGHPAGMNYMFTTGTVSRFVRYKPDDKPIETWMSVTAEFAYGSSGSPVVNRQGAVVGMAAMTEAIDYPDSPAPDAGKDDKEPGKEGKPPVDPKKPALRRQPIPVRRAADEKPVVNKGSPLQMVVKLAVPLAEIRSTASAGER